MKLILAIPAIMAIMAMGQQTQPGAADYTATSLTFLLKNPPQAVPSGNISARRLDNPGACSYYYWVIAKYLVGNAGPSGPAAITDATCSTLTNGNIVNWSFVTGATGYDVLETTTPNPPQGACNCAIALNNTSGTVTDTGTRSNYTVTTFDPGQPCVLDNETTGVGAANLLLHGCTLQTSALSSGSTTVNGQTCALGGSCTIGGAPTGAAGGDLSGNYPNPTVAKVDGVSYPASPSNSTVPVVTSPGTITYEQVPNAALQNPSVTVNGTTCTLGGSCTPSGGISGSGTPGQVVQWTGASTVGNISGQSPNTVYAGPPTPSQTAVVVQTASGGVGNASSATATFPHQTTAGNTLVTCIFASAGTPTLSDTSGDTFSQLFAGSNNATCYISSNIIGGATSFTYSNTGGNQTIGIGIIEVQGLVNASPLDTFGQLSSFTNPSQQVCTSGVAQGNELVIGFWGADFYPNTISNLGAGSGYILDAAVLETGQFGNGNDMGVIFEHFNKTSGLTGAQCATFSFTPPASGVGSKGGTVFTLKTTGATVSSPQFRSLTNLDLPNNISDSGETDVRRLRFANAQHYSGADSAIVLSAGWGNTAAVSAANGVDQAFSFTATANGTGIAANPTITVTWKDGSMKTNFPITLCKRNDTSSPADSSAVLTWVDSQTTLTLTFNGTPTSGVAYAFFCQTTPI